MEVVGIARTVIVRSAMETGYASACFFSRYLASFAAVLGLASFARAKDFAMDAKELVNVLVAAIVICPVGQACLLDIRSKYPARNSRTNL